ncbi:hypothetical protein ACLEPN_17935 [Myxococcus sp. 1LA]
MAGQLVRSIPDCNADLDEFLREIQRTVQWCSSRANRASPQACLRTPDLLPQPLLPPNRFDLIDSIATERRHKLERTKEVALSASPPGHDILQGGRLLAFFPDETLSDGAAEASSQGYFDWANVPPWDTWVGMFSDENPHNRFDREYVIAWVAPMFVELVDAGLQVNPEECIQWLKDTETSMAQRLQGLRQP